ncbi:carboxypeptidase regulatory-like domain-containing protein [Amycolatopsis cynarae]|uniref:Carboxypeptidase regulatory-like domain-containing protein n=1 Tax=Amycolatopsis cynarae TaxID=2995223 RepID=A0ABY7AW40_9PSEU|nr:carboxypeptidase regulatory-like domain-containing protein [Amycolatopsis sp. HUAS 11-8]WAL63142.1 carboxypeptidase regulatory-like domain-containing protein [Amycolatopsis sp. HUAS 11-8]
MTGAIPRQERPGTEITGRVRDEAGTPVPGSAVTLVDADGQQAGRTAAGEDGGFALHAPARGTYVLIASAAGHQPEAATVNVADAPVRIEVALRGTGGLHGVVRSSETGVPIMGAAVTVTDPRGEVIGSRLSGPGGDYTLPGLPAGTYTLAVNAPGYRPTALAVTTGATASSRQDVELADGAVIHGTVRLPEGSRPAVTVTLLDTGGNVVRTGTADDRGRYAFHDLDPGTYTVVAASWSPSRRQVRVADGVRNRHDVRLS